MTEDNAAELQSRIDRLLAEPIEEGPEHRYSPYRTADGSILAARFEGAARDGGVRAAVEAAERAMETKNHGAVRHALRIFLTHNAEATRLGLHVPGLGERAPWKIG